MTLLVIVLSKLQVSMALGKTVLIVFVCTFGCAWCVHDFAYAKRELRIEGRFEAILPSLLHSVRCKQKAVDRWLADLHVTLLSV